MLTIPNGILLRPKDLMQTAPSKVGAVVSGTQGEPMSAMSRVAVDNHKSLSIEPGDTVALSACIIPGNEKAIYRMMNHLARRGADVVYGAMNPPIHVSGHGSAEEASPCSEPGPAKIFPVDSRRLSPDGDARQACAAPSTPGRGSGERGSFAVEPSRKVRTVEFRRIMAWIRCEEVALPNKTSLARGLTCIFWFRARVT
jgi:hypothetical protein